MRDYYFQQYNAINTIKAFRTQTVLDIRKLWSLAYEVFQLGFLLGQVMAVLRNFASHKSTAVSLYTPCTIKMKPVLSPS